MNFFEIRYNSRKRLLNLYLTMSDFWTNVSRYPRFFISSLAGLILIILTPFRNLLKVKKFRIVFPLILIGFFTSLSVILKNMTGL